MKKNIIFLLLIIITPLIHAQELNLISTSIATAGLSNETEVKQTVNISKWRIGEVHLLTIQGNDQLKLDRKNKELEVYPNPFLSTLNLKIKAEGQSDYLITVSDMLGRKCMHFEDKTFLPNQFVGFDMSQLKSGMYILKVIPKNNNIQWVVKIQKQ